jgi:hypothetical protein
VCSSDLHDEDLERSTYSANANGLIVVEMGYFQSLNANFRSTEEELRNNYLQKTTAIDREL